jgi:hypothetical protein
MGTKYRMLPMNDVRARNTGCCQRRVVLKETDCWYGKQRAEVEEALLHGSHATGKSQRERTSTRSQVRWKMGTHTPSCTWMTSLTNSFSTAPVIIFSSSCTSFAEKLDVK